MKASKHLDAMVAEKVMGWTWVEDDGYWKTGQQHEPAGWSPSTDIAAAWVVVEKLEAMGWVIEVGLCNAEYGPQKRAWCEVGEYGPDGRTVGEGYEDTAPLAICVAALAAAFSKS